MQHPGDEPGATPNDPSDDPARTSKPGRRPNPVIGYGPAAQFAELLRECRAKAGDPAYATMAVKGSNRTTMSLADSGHLMPLWSNTKVYLEACGVTAQADLDAWAARHEEHRRRAALFLPHLGGIRSREVLLSALRAVLVAARVDRNTLLQRRADTALRCNREAADPGGRLKLGAPTRLEGPVPSVEELLAYPRPDRMIPWVVYLSGGTDEDGRIWAARLGLIPDTAVNLGDPDGADGPAGPGDPDADGGTPQILAPVPADRGTPADPAPPLATVNTRGGPPRRRAEAGPRARVAMVAFVVAVVSALFSGTITDRGVHRLAGPARPGPSGTPVPPPPSRDPGDPAGPELAAIIAVLDPAEPVGGDQAHVDLRITEYGPPPLYPDVVRDITDELDWSRSAPGRRTVTGSDAPATPEPLLTGPPVGAPEPLTADPAELQGVLERRRRSGGGATALILGVTDLYDAYPLTGAQRIAVLRMLGTAPDFVYRGKTTVTTAAGSPARPAKLFSADSAGGIRDTIAVDIRTGHVIQHETTILGSAGAEVTVRRKVYLRSAWDHLPD